MDRHVPRRNANNAQTAHTESYLPVTVDSVIIRTSMTDNIAHLLHGLSRNNGGSVRIENACNSTHWSLSELGATVLRIRFQFPTQPRVYSDIAQESDS